MSVEFHGHVSYTCAVAAIVNIEMRSVNVDDGATSYSLVDGSVNGQASDNVSACNLFIIQPFSISSSAANGKSPPYDL